MAMVMQGPLVKQGANRHSWKSRWFVLTRGETSPPFSPPALSYYETSSKKRRLGHVELGKCMRAERKDYGKSHEGHSHLIEVEVPGRVYRLLCKSTQDADQWLAPLVGIVQENLAAQRRTSTTSLAAAFPPPSNTILTDGEGNLRASTHFCRGWLRKLGANVKTWKRRWFLMQGDKIKYYREKGDYRPMGVIDLNQCTDVGEKFEPGLEYGFYIKTPSRTYILSADDGAGVQMWLTAVTAFVRARDPLCNETSVTVVRTRSEALRPERVYDHTESSESEEEPSQTEPNRTESPPPQPECNDDSLTQIDESDES